MPSGGPPPAPAPGSAGPGLEDGGVPTSQPRRRAIVLIARFQDRAQLPLSNVTVTPARWKSLTDEPELLGYQQGAVGIGGARGQPQQRRPGGPGGHHEHPAAALVAQLRCRCVSSTPGCEPGRDAHRHRISRVATPHGDRGPPSTPALEPVASGGSPRPPPTPRASNAAGFEARLGPHVEHHEGAACQGSELRS